MNTIINTQPRLNHDILLQVMWACPRDDCARFMRTCRFLHNHGHRVLLSHDLHLLQEKDILRVLEYLQLQNDRRSRHVRSMHLNTGAAELSESTALALAAALPLMHNLQELLITDSEYLLSSHPNLFRAIAALTTLRSIHLTDMGELAVDMLQFLRSQLVHIVIDFDTETLEDSGEYLIGFPALPDHSRTTLQEIAIHRWYELPDTPASDEQAFVFPETRRLILGQPLRPPLAQWYTRGFPALSHLSLGAAESELEMSDVEDIRQQNISDQAESGCAWKTLDELNGDLIDVYTLGFTCTVEHMHLGEIYPNELQMLGPVLLQARPRELSIDKWPAAGRIHDSADDVFVAFRGQGGARLEELVMEVELKKGDGEMDISVILEALLSALATDAPLQALRLEIAFANVDPRPKEVITRKVSKRSKWRRGDPMRPLPDIEQYPLTVAEQSVVNFDSRDYVRRFTVAVPTLRIVQINFGGVRNLYRMTTLVDGEVHVGGSW